MEKKRVVGGIYDYALRFHRCTMGLLRALFITAVVFFIVRVVTDRFLAMLPEVAQATLLPHLPLVVVFLIELLL